MEGGPLLADWWKSATKRFVPYLNISALLPDKPDQQMLETYGLRGFPSFLILDAEGQVLFGKETYWRPDNPGSLETGLTEVETIFRLRRKVASDPDDALAKAHLTLLLGFLNLEQCSFEAMEAAIQVEGIPAELVGRWLREKARIRFLEVFVPYRSAFTSGAEKVEIQKLRRVAIDRAYSMVCENQVLTESDAEFRGFWVLAFDGAIEASNRKVAAECLKVYQEAYGWADRFVSGMAERLDKLPAIEVSQ